MVAAVDPGRIRVAKELFTTAVGKRLGQAVDKLLRARQDKGVKRIGQIFTSTFSALRCAKAVADSPVIAPGHDGSLTCPSRVWAWWRQLFTTAVGKRHQQAVDNALRARQDGRVKRIGQTFTSTRTGYATRGAVHLSGVISANTGQISSAQQC
jgi:hypothetical protein